YGPKYVGGNTRLYRQGRVEERPAPRRCCDPTRRNGSRRYTGSTTSIPPPTARAICLNGEGMTMPEGAGLLFWLWLSALAAGAVNSVAGGGTLLTFPALLAALSPMGPEAAKVANATSTVALVPGSLAGAWGYRHEMHSARRWLSLLLGPSLIGGALGSLLVLLL